MRKDMNSVPNHHSDTYNHFIKKLDMCLCMYMYGSGMTILGGASDHIKAIGSTHNPTSKGNTSSEGMTGLTSFSLRQTSWCQ